MGAYVEHSFARGFILDEARLRRIKDSVEERLARRSSTLPLQYKVFRGDSYSYVTRSVDDVVREENEDWRRITRLDILVESKNDLEMELTFAKKGVELHITGEDRDEVFLLFSDLRDYIQHEVATVMRMDRNLERIAFLLIMLLFFPAMAFLLSNQRTPEQTQAALSNPSPVAKLNFLIAANENQQTISRRTPIAAGVPALLSVIVLLGLPAKLLAFLYPSNIFVFGSQRQVFDRRTHLRGNLLWVGLVGLLVSVIAGFVVWYITK